MIEVDAAPTRANAEATARRRPSRRARLGGLVLPVAGLALLVAVWWLAVLVFDVAPLLLPAPPSVLAEFTGQPAELLRQTGATTVEILLGFGLSVAVGALVGAAIAASRTIERMFYPLTVAFNAVPKVALAPLLVAWLGFGNKPILTMVVLVSFFPIVLGTATGLTTTPAELAELVRSLDASRWQAFRKVRLPAALPHIFVGLKVAMPLAGVGAIIGEFSAGERGLGFVIQQAGGLGQSALAFAALGLLAIVTIVLYFTLVGVERLLLPWVRATTSQR